MAYNLQTNVYSGNSSLITQPFKLRVLNVCNVMYVMPLAQKKTVKQMQPSLSLIVSMTSEIMEMNKVGTDGEI